MEIWKAIKGFEGIYEVSNTGKVRSLNYRSTGRVQELKQCRDKDGYLHVNLCRSGEGYNSLVHRLVAAAFLQLPIAERANEVNHINERKSDNRVENLEYVSREENINHGTLPRRLGTARSKAVVGVDAATGKQVFYFAKIVDAERLGLSRNAISAACHGKRKTPYCGIIWRFEEVMPV